MVVGDMDRAGADPDGGERMRRRRRGKCDMQEGGREGGSERERERGLLYYYHAP
jgi:hypothetical protein